MYFNRRQKTKKQKKNHIANKEWAGPGARHFPSSSIGAQFRKQRELSAVYKCREPIKQITPIKLGGDAHPH